MSIAPSQTNKLVICHYWYVCYAWGHRLEWWLWHHNFWKVCILAQQIFSFWNPFQKTTVEYKNFIDTAGNGCEGLLNLLHSFVPKSWNNLNIDVSTKWFTTAQSVTVNFCTNSNVFIWLSWKDNQQIWAHLLRLWDCYEITWWNQSYKSIANHLVISERTRIKSNLNQISVKERSALTIATKSTGNQTKFSIVGHRTDW